ncbi:hypothetical protein HMPREF1432_00074 [Helicobacter pylori GAMchJs114i]|nr:hypothetical protein HMPREF1432_00074 [Helicobacter pylori GAMchJs114i]
MGLGDLVGSCREGIQNTPYPLKKMSLKQSNQNPIIRLVLLDRTKPLIYFSLQ